MLTRTACSLATPPPRKIATSLKRPHWLLLGFDDHLGQCPGVSQVSLHNTKLAVFRTEPSRELRVALDACPHRGASLSAGGTVAGGCVNCSYHGRAIGIKSHPERFLDYAVQDGLVWADYASNLLTQHHGPPSYPEHSDPGMRTFGYTKILDVNPVLMTENTLDWQHLSHVHRVHFIEGNPVVTIRETAPGHGKAEYAYQSDMFDLVIENEYHIPFTTSLRFRFRHRDTGVPLPTLLLWFSVAPAAHGKTALHLRVSRGALKSPMADWLFRLIDELPLLEDVGVVSGVDPGEWSKNRLDPKGDEFVARYRRDMADNFPEVLDWYVS